MTKLARRIGAAIVGAGLIGVLAIFASASPAAADNGPHITTIGTTVIGAGPDGCAGCHRLHSSKIVEFLNTGTESGEAFCETCHDGTDADTNVKDGQLSATPTTSTSRALRGGGFLNAWIYSYADSTKMSGTNGTLVGLEAIKGNFYGATGTSRNTFGNPANAVGGAYWASMIPASDVSVPVTSTHTMGAGTLWGAATTADAGESVDLECVSCHDPHGNNNYRILRPIGQLTRTGTATSVVSNVFTPYAAVTHVKVETDTFNTARYALTFTVTGANNFQTGQAVTVRTTGASDAAVTTYLTSGVVMEVVRTGTMTIKVPYQSSLSGGLVNGDDKDITAFVVPAFPSQIVLAKTSDANAKITYTTAAEHGLYVGQKVRVVSADSASTSGFIVTKATITDVPSLTSFKVANASGAAITTAGVEAYLYIYGIPDAIAVNDSLDEATGYASGKAGYKKVYTTTNYFLADDHYYKGTYQANSSFTRGDGTTATYSGTKNGYIVNIAQWCTTCHTRYMSGGSSGRNFAHKVNGVTDATFTYRHTANNLGGEASANCIQCHVAHGSNAQMTGQFTSALTDPNGLNPSNGSRLLRANNRGICMFCHTM